MFCVRCGREIVEQSKFCSVCGARQGGPKRLMRSSTDSKMAGVCGGLAEYFRIDSGILRILVVLVSIATGIVFGLIAYIVAWIILPLSPEPAPEAARSSA